MTRKILPCMCTAFMVKAKEICLRKLVSDNDSVVLLWSTRSSYGNDSSRARTFNSMRLSGNCHDAF